MPDASSNSNGFAKSITVDNTKVAGDVTDFPVWISLAGDTDLEAHARDDHGDVYFTDASGMPIAYEITAWDRASGTLQAWVRADHLTPAGGTQDTNEMIVRFGGGDAPLASNGSTVFDNRYAAVWHLEKGTSTIPDATGQVPGTLVGNAPPSAGQLGNGLTFSGAASSITFTNPITGNGASTFSAWVDQANVSGTVYSYSLIVVGTALTDQSRWFYSRYGGGSDSVAAGLYSDDHVPAPAEVLPTGTWKKLDWVYGTDKKSHIYVDGVEVGGGTTLGTAATAGATGVLANAPPGYAPPGDSMAFNGVLDEVRISDTPRSANWLKTAFNNQSSPSTFYTVGPALAQ